MFIEQTKGLPLISAVQFGTDYGLARELAEIERRANQSSLTERWARAARKGCIVHLFRERGIFDEFVDGHWTFARTHEGRKKLIHYEGFRKKLLDGNVSPGTPRDEAPTSLKSEADNLPNEQESSSALTAPQAILPPVEGAESLIVRIRTLKGLPERNHEDAVKDLLVRLGFDPSAIVFQVGRIDVCVYNTGRQEVGVFEVKCSIARTSKHDKALRQGMDYALRTGAEIVVITDGDRYEIYDRRSGRDYESMLCGKFQLTNFHAEDAKLLDMLRPAALCATRK